MHNPKRRLRRQHPALHRIMRPLDLGDVHEPRRAPDERPAGEVEPRDALQPALVEHARGVGEPLGGAREEAPEVRVVFEFLWRGGGG